MRLIHTSDLHIGSPLTSVLDGARARERAGELVDSFAALIRDARALCASCVIIAGDLFDSDKVPRRTVESVLSLIRDAEDTVFLLLAGNHDGEIVRASGLKLPQNLRFFNTGWTYYRIGDVTVAGRSQLKEDMFDTLKLNERGHNIVVLHGEVREGSFREGVIPIRDAAGRGIDYMALGHYHSYAEYPVDERCRAVYCGTPEGRGFDECGEKGYVVIDIGPDGLKHYTKNCAKRILRTVTVDITGARDNEEWQWRVESRLRGIPDTDLVRVEIIGRYSPGIIRDTSGLIRLFGHKFYHFEVKDLSTLAIDMRDYEHDRSIKGEFVRSVMADETLTEEERGEVISCGLYALTGEAIYDR